MQVASENDGQKNADNKDADQANATPDEVPDTRTGAMPQEVPNTMTNAAPGSCTRNAQGDNGVPMRVPGSDLRTTSGKVSGRSTPWALEYWLCVRARVCVSVSVSACECVCLCLFVVVRCPALPHTCSESVDMS